MRTESFARKGGQVRCVPQADTALLTLCATLPAPMTLSVPLLGDRSLFPDLAPRAYLAHAAVSPLSLPVVQAMTLAISDYARRGVPAAIEHGRARERLRASFARLLGATPVDIAFVQSMSVAATIIARSLPARPGERIVVFEGEFPANVMPWELAARERGLTVERLSLSAFEHSDAAGLAELEAVLRRGVRLVAVSAVQFQTGLRMPIAAMSALCHAHGAEIFVDAIQALGVLPFDARALDVDYAAASGHKFLMGPEGTGVMYVHPRALARLSRGFAGWTSVADAFRFLVDGPGHLHYDAEVVARAGFVEQGAQNVVGLCGLAAALDVIEALGVAAIAAHVTRYLDALEPLTVALGCTSLRARESERRSALLCLRLPPGTNLHAVAERMAAQGVVVSTPDGFLRMAPHFANALDEVPFVADALRTALKP